MAENQIPQLFTTLMLDKGRWHVTSIRAKSRATVDEIAAESGDLAVELIPVGEADRLRAIKAAATEWERVHRTVNYWEPESSWALANFQRALAATPAASGDDHIVVEPQRRYVAQRGHEVVQVFDVLRWRAVEQRHISHPDLDGTMESAMAWAFAEVERLDAGAVGVPTAPSTPEPTTDVWPQINAHHASTDDVVRRWCELMGHAPADVELEIHACPEGAFRTRAMVAGIKVIELWTRIEGQP